jgi:hypothetical protein
MQQVKSVSAPSLAQALSSGGDSGDIFTRTLRTVAILVGACILFVGLLSTAAVLIASKAVAPSPHSASVEPTELPAKKPLSI